MYTLPDLPYSYDALEPHLDGATLRIHHQKHHQSYVDKLNAALDQAPEWKTLPLEELLLSVDSLPQAIRSTVFQNGGGHYNHSLFWTVLTPHAKERPEGKLLQALEQSFGGFESFREKFSELAVKHFASGWAWLCVDKQGNLIMESLKDHEYPLTQTLQPIFVLDLWEHAYYLKFQNRRAEFIKACWNVVNWDAVAQRLEQAKGKFRSAA
jgi:Fe-Mn family superoxide dismutase